MPTKRKMDDGHGGSTNPEYWLSILMGAMDRCSDWGKMVIDYSKRTSKLNLKKAPTGDLKAAFKRMESYKHFLPRPSQTKVQPWEHLQDQIEAELIRRQK